MNTVKRASYSLLVACLVFVWLALPILTQMLGPIVYIPVYALVALVAGGLAWSALGWLSSSERDTSSIEKTDLSEESLDTGDSPDIDVDSELEELKGGR